MKWHNSLANNIKIENIPYRLLKVNDQIYDSIFERNGEYYLSIKCGVATYSKNHSYENFITDGFKMIYELPKTQQQEIKIDLKNIKNFLQENKTVLSSIPGSDISLDADIKTEYIAHRELDQSILIKYDNHSLKDFPMEKRNYDENIIVERLLNETEETIGYEKENKFYIDIKESRDYIKVIEDGAIANDKLNKDGDSIELPSELAEKVSWDIAEGTNVVANNTTETTPLKLLQMTGDSKQDTTNYSIQSIGDLYTDDQGQPILDDQNRKQYLIEILSKDGHNILNLDPSHWTRGSQNGDIVSNISKVKPNTTYTFKQNVNQWTGIFNRGRDGTSSTVIISQSIQHTTFTTPADCEYISFYAGYANYDCTVPMQREMTLYEGTKNLPLSQESNTKTYVTQFLLPCQLMKIGNVSDKLYWDEDKGKYCIEKNIDKFTDFSHLYRDGWYAKSVDAFHIDKPCINNDKNKDIMGSNNYMVNGFKNVIYHYYQDQIINIFDSYNTHYFTFPKPTTLEEAQKHMSENAPIWYQAKTPDIIETNITELISIKTCNKKTYLSVDGPLSSFFKIKVPVSIEYSNQIFLPRENNFDSILNVTVEPNKNTNITFFEGGLDLKLASGLDILETGAIESKKPGYYASKDFINLAAYTSSTFTIDTIDIAISNMQIYYYNKDKGFIGKETIVFENGQYHKSKISYPANTKYCKIAFSVPNIISDYCKVRILRDKTKESGFQTIKKIFRNDNKYTKSFSSIVPIKHDIERLIVCSNAFSSIKAFDIINNLDKNHKIHSYKIPRKLEPGETLSYTKAGKKQFIYKSNSTPYNSIINANYTRPYKEYNNIVDNARFSMFQKLEDNGNVVKSSEPYCATEDYINIAAYQGKTITLSTASLIEVTSISFYTNNKTHIKRHYGNGNSYTVQVPSNAQYMRGGCYVKTLAAESAETKELIQKHVMVTLTTFRCDFVPYGVKHSCTIIPEIIGLEENQHKLNLNINNRYLFVEPYKFNYTMKDLNSVLNTATNNSGKWKFDMYTTNVSNNTTLEYLQSITQAPNTSMTVEQPSTSLVTVQGLLVFTKYIKVSNNINITTSITTDDNGSIYLNNELIKKTTVGAAVSTQLSLVKGVNKLVVIVWNAGAGGGMRISPDISTTLNQNIESVGHNLDYNDIVLAEKFNVSNFFAHDIVDGKLLVPKQDMSLRLDKTGQDKFVFAKDFTVNPDKEVDGYVNANSIQEAPNSKTYINRVYGGEANLTLLTVGGNVCEIYFLNDYLIEDNSHYTLYAEYTSGNQKIKINKIPDNARYIAIVTDKENEGEKCSNIFLFPGDITRSIDTTSENFEMFDNFDKEIATLPYSSEIVIGKNKLPDLSKLAQDSSKHTFDEDNHRLIFPIKLEKDVTDYYLQYWTDNINDSLDVFIDSTRDMASDTKQYLCNHISRYNTINNVIKIENRILTDLDEDNTLYLSVSLTNATSLSIANFLREGLYKFQLEKGVYTEDYEAYEETVKHHPMYLTSNGLTIESSSSYYGIRTLIAPQNVVSISNNGLTRITWDEVIGASHYILYLEKEEYQIVDTNVFETKKEIKGLMSVKAKNSITESEFSKDVYVHSVPTNPFILHIENKYEDEKYKFYVYFRDDSNIEESFNLRYSVDGRQEQVTKLPAVENIGETSEAYFTVADIRENVAVRITAINDSGENEVASQFILKIMPDFVWTYNENNNKIVMAWDNKYPECSDYVVRYKKKDDEVAKTFKITNNYREDERVTYSIDLEPEDVMEVSISALKDDIYYIFTQPKTVSKDLDVTKTPPSHFTSIKPQNDTIEFSWFDNSTVETGWELVYSINNGSPQTITIPTKSQTTDYQLYKHLYEFDRHGYMTAKLRTIWELGASNFTESITNYYYPIDNKPPQGLKKRYESRTSILITWDPPQYFESYELVITKGEGDDQVKETIKTKDNRYIINLNDQVIEKYRVKVKTNFLGDQQSDYTKELVFTPTFSDNKILTTINTKCREEYVDIRKLIADRISDEFNVVTRSTSKVSWSFPLVTATLNRFQTYEGLLSMETWNTGQRTEYTDAIIIKTVKANMHEAIINTISYQETKCEGYLEGFIYTPSTISGKIVMEINKTRIVCIGDSITAGHPGFWAESMTGEITHQYPYWLDRRLKFQYEVINKGYGSDRTFNVLNRFQKDVLDLSPQYCLMQIGTNDIYWGGASADGSIEAFDSSTLADMKKNVMAMVELCFQNDIVPIIGMLIPRTQVVTDPVVKHGLYKFNEWIIEYANSTEGLNYVDFFNAGKDKIPATPLEDPKSPGAMNPIYDGDNVYDEMGNLVKYGAGIHLNAVGYRIMAEAIPLNLFTTIQSGVKMYMDEKCTIEAEYNTDDKQNPFYEIEIEGMKLTRTKKIVRYIKNIGNTQVLFSIYPNDLHNLDYNFKFKDTDEGTKTISGILTPGNSRAIKMELTPLTEDSKSSIELSLVSREFSIETK